MPLGALVYITPKTTPQGTYSPRDVFIWRLCLEFLGPPNTHVRVLLPPHLFRKQPMQRSPRWPDLRIDPGVALLRNLGPFGNLTRCQALELLLQRLLTELAQRPDSLATEEVGLPMEKLVGTDPQLSRC